MNSEIALIDVFEKHLPEGYGDLCLQLWKEYRFTLKITPTRKTKVGDYRFDQRNNRHSISINYNLNPYGFLITYLHEVAHMQAMLEYGPKIGHHGAEWKSTFRRLLIMALTINKLPVDITTALAKYAKNPKASSYSDPALVMALSRYDVQKTGSFLTELLQGQEFVFQGRTYKMLKKRRTRVLCERVDNCRRYLISGHAQVQVLE